MIRRTPLYDRHLAAGGRMVEFAGWEMPVQYTSILDEHRAVREHCGIFDISHMGEFLIRGSQASEWLDSVLTNRVAELRVGEAQYTLMLNGHGGIIDDLIIYRIDEQEFLLIVNAAKIDEDFAWLEKHRTGFSSHGDRAFFELFDCSDAYAAIAVQGPASPQVFAKVFSLPWERRRNRIIELTPHAAPSAPKPEFAPGGSRAFAATTGYTGESGFETIIPVSNVKHYWDLFLAAGAKPCGLGARDTLRLEMCYPLNGSDLSSDRTPPEAGLGLFVDLAKGEFIGRDALLNQKAHGPPVKLAALRVQEKSPPIRAHYPVFAAGVKIAETTSGALSPSLNCGIALAYLPVLLAKVGQDLEIEVRGSRYKALVVKKPFYNSKR